MMPLYMCWHLDFIVNLEIIIGDTDEATEVRESRDDTHIRTQCMGPYPMWTLCNDINYQCIYKGSQAWKEERRKKKQKVLLCYPKAKTFILTNRLDDTPCMKVGGPLHVMENPPEQ